MSKPTHSAPEAHSPASPPVGEAVGPEGKPKTVRAPS